MPSRRIAAEASSTGRDFGDAIEEDLRFQIRSWRLQRAGWVLGVVLIAAAVVGLFGNGPMSTATARSADGAVEVTYDRLARHGSPTRLNVDVHPALVGDGPVVIWLAREFLDGLEIEAVIPEPARVVDSERRTGYEFDVEHVGSDGLDVTFRVRYDDVFLRHGELSVGSEDPIAFDMLVYP